MSNAHLIHMYRYHEWRVGRMARFVAKLPPEQFDLPIVGSFSPLRRLLAHLQAAERNLFASATEQDRHSFAPVNRDDTHALLAAWQEDSQRWRPLLETHDDVWLDTEVPFRLPGLDTKVTRRQLFLQNVDHSSYHVGQVTVAARALGADSVPGNGYLQYVLSNPSSPA